MILLEHYYNTPKYCFVKKMTTFFILLHFFARNISYLDSNVDFYTTPSDLPWAVWWQKKGVWLGSSHYHKEHVSARFLNAVPAAAVIRFPYFQVQQHRECLEILLGLRLTYRLLPDEQIMCSMHSPLCLYKELVSPSSFFFSLAIGSIVSITTVHQIKQCR